MDDKQSVDAKQYAKYIGEHELTIDEKNRMLVPSDVRKEMDPDRDGDGFYLVIGSNKKPWLYGQKYYNELLAREEQQLTPKAAIRPNQPTLDEWHKTFAMASKSAWDKQGRILLPETLLRRTGIERDVTLIGVRNHLEIWNRRDWETRFNELLLMPDAAE